MITYQITYKTETLEDMMMDYQTVLQVKKKRPKKIL